MVLEVAREQARELGHGWLGTEHLLLGVLAARPRVVEFLPRVTFDRVRGVVEHVRGLRQEGVETRHFSSRVQGVLDLAGRATRAQGRLITADDLGLAILEQGEGVAMWVLNKVGLEPERLERGPDGDFEPLHQERERRRLRATEGPMRERVQLELEGLLTYARGSAKAADAVPDRSIEDVRGFIGGALTMLARLDLVSAEELARWRERIMAEIPPTDTGRFEGR